MITTEQDALEAVRQDGMALEDVPEKLKTPEICAEAVCGSGWALAFVPEALKTPELCLAASRDARAEAFVLMPARSAVHGRGSRGCLAGREPPPGRRPGQARGAGD
jgi:hypothetical protein